MFEVRTQAKEITGVDEDGKAVVTDIPNSYNVETRRTSEKVAKEDVAALALFGKKGWITEC